MRRWVRPSAGTERSPWDFAWARRGHLTAQYCGRFPRGISIFRRSAIPWRAQPSRRKENSSGALPNQSPRPTCASPNHFPAAGAGMLVRLPFPRPGRGCGAVPRERHSRTLPPALLLGEVPRGLVVTHSLAGADFHGHRPAVWMNQHPSWVLMSGQLDPLSTLSVHPASPVLLTRSGPLCAGIRAPGSIRQPGFRPHLKFENKSRAPSPRCF